jgi:ubiquinone/menaquinone biosynthesis C-methylase UbiE
VNSWVLFLLLLLALGTLLVALIARQVGKPSGWFGRRVMASLLNEGNRDLLDSALDAAAVTPGATVLDVGFGGGYALDRLAPLVRPERVAGVEISEAMLSVVRKRSGGAYDLYLADAAALPFPEGTFDRVLSVNTIYFWPDPSRTLAEMKRVLRSGACLVLGYQSQAALRTNPLTWFGFRTYSDSKMRRLLEEAGFTVEIRSPRHTERIAVGTKP